MGIGLGSAFNTASMGIKASEKMINVIGNNLANANTTGFKAERANFEDMLSYTYLLGTEPSATNGGTDPLQIGMGVVLDSVTTNFTQGTVKEGMTKTDLAISGNGFFIVQPTVGDGSTRQYYTRDGVMKIDGNHVLTTSDGLYVMGYTVNDEFQLQTDALSSLRIPVGEMKIAEATTEVTIDGILNAAGSDSTQGTILQSETLADISVSNPGDATPTASQVPRPSVESADTLAQGATVSSGAIEEGRYVYHFVYARNGNGLGDETDYSTAIGATVGSGENGIVLSNLPLGEVPANADPPYTDLRIYRSEIGANEQGGDFHLLDSISLASISDPATFTYTDTKSTGSIESGEVLNLDRLNGDYTYCVTYTNQYGESSSSAIGGAVTVNNGQVMLSGIPAVEGANPDGWTGRNVYRQGPDGQYYLVASVAGMDPDVTVVDNIPDSKLVNQQELSAAGRGNALPDASTKLLNLAQVLSDGSFVPVFELGTLSFTGTKGDTALSTHTLEITKDTTVREYLDFLEQSLGIQSGGEIPTDQGTLGKELFDGYQGARMIDGKISILGNAGTGNTLSFTTRSQQLTANGHTSNIGVSFDSVQQANGESVTTYLTVYDSLGAEVNVRLTMTLDSKTDTSTTYRWYADSGDNQPLSGNDISVGTGTMTFDSNGKLISYTEPKISIMRTDLASQSPMEFDFHMDLGSIAALATSNAKLSQTGQDGTAAGILTDYTIGTNGIITGIFDTGATRTLGQVLLASFTNQDGLTKLGDNLFAASMNSGNATIGTPGDAQYGKIKQYSIELSNVDIGNELIDMILASAMYRANTKVVTTADEMFDTLMRMV